jgi:hypothetical protein
MEGGFTGKGWQFDLGPSMYGLRLGKLAEVMLIQAADRGVGEYVAADGSALMLCATCARDTDATPQTSR